MAIRLDEARLRLLKIVDTSNTVKIYPNTVSSYGGLAVEGYTKGGYQGIHLGSSTNYMTVMSGEDQQGLYNQATGRWIIYYKRTSDAIGIGTSYLVANNRVTITNNASITNLLTVGYAKTHYGIKVGNTYINAINGDLILQNNNTIRFGADDWDYNKWAGLKYDSTNKYIYLGIADGTIFSANSSQSGGRILTPGISHFHVGNQTTYYMTSSGDIKASSITVDNNNSSGSIQLVEDGEGGTIRLYSKSNTYCYEIDAFNDETIRIHTAHKNPNGENKFISWNGKSGNLSADGTFYVKNVYPVMPMKSANGYYGMTLPDTSDTDWIRTTNYGIIPYASGGSSALGTESWPFNDIWSKTVNIIDTYYPAFRLTAKTVNSFSTYSKGMFEVNYTDSIGMWIHSDKTTDTKSRRALVVYGWGAKSDAAQAVALRQCNTSGTWLSDLYLLHTGNYNSYALPLAGGTMSSEAAIKFTATAGSIATSDPMSITYGRIAAYGTLCINANTDNSGTEYVILTAGKGHSSSTADGLTIGTSTLTWQGATVLTSSNYAGTLDGRYVNATGDSMSGNLSFSAPTGGSTTPTNQRISINGVNNDSSVANAPGIGFHIGGLNWGTLKFQSDGSFRFYNNGCTGYMPVYGSKVYGAVWNDYAEYRSQFENISAGRVAYCKNDGKLRITAERLQKFEGVVSDTFGFAIGETDNAKTPLAVSGRALVYTYEPRDTFNSGDCVCAAPNGTVSKMSREEIVAYPDRIVGIVSEIPEYETWGTGEVPVDGRIWIKVK